MSEPAPTRPSLIRQDFELRGPSGGYFYPFSADVPDFSQFPDEPWDGSLGEVARGDDGIYRKPGFDLEHAIDSIPGPILEIGGPSRKGYSLLQGKELPSKPIITNVRGSLLDSRGEDSLTAIDRLVLRALMDSRKLSVASDSLGMVLASCIDQTDKRTLSVKSRTAGLNKDEVWTLARQMGEQVYSDALNAIEHHDLTRLAQTESPRIGVLVQAARTLKRGGLLDMSSLWPQDIFIANALGLETVMHTPLCHAILEDPYGGPDEPATYIDEAIFQRKR